VPHLSFLELVCGVPSVMVYTATDARALFLRTECPSWRVDW